MAEIDDIRDARYIGLHSPPKTELSQKLVHQVIDCLKAQEHRERARQEEVEKMFAQSVGLILGDLLLGYQQEGNGWSFHELSSPSFTDLPIGYKMFRGIVKAMEKTNLIEVAKGRNHKGFEFQDGQRTYIPGLATRFRPLPSLITMANDCGLKKGEYNDHFPTQLPKKVIEVRATKKKGEGGGRKIKLPASKRSEQLAEEVKSINDFLSSFTLANASFSGFRRIFSEGERDDFDYNLGGRLYCAGDKSYMTLSSLLRRQTLINNEKVVEIDINASYLTILHGLKGNPMPERDDVYAIGGLPRDVVKKWFAITIGVQKFHSQWLPGNVAELSKTCLAYRPWMTVKAVQKTVLEYFPFMADWPSGEVRWSHLMFIESEIIIATMKQMMIQHHAPAFPIHDSIIVRKSDQDLAMETLAKQFQLLTGITPRLKVK